LSSRWAVHDVDFSDAGICSVALRAGGRLVAEVDKLVAVCFSRTEAKLELIEVKSSLAHEWPRRVRRPQQTKRWLLQFDYEHNRLELASDHWLAPIARAGFAGVVQDAAAIARGPIVLRCTECGRWNYHLSTCSRRFR
jgi:hypothetical protein